MLLLHPYPSLCLLPPATYHPYCHVVPSQNASNATLNSTYHPYSPAVPSRCYSNSALTTPYASAPPPLIILTLWRCPQDNPPTPAPHLHAHPSLRLCTPLSSLLLTLLMLLY
ncbi:hypothetical protein O181_007642 [Austropuccinia psidii MF-1]|uniref:Uncharacterized protein n=1 Tax=Austropuccinia psidii MF-1 TaxID=1389203 RepID=A0A9Q3BN63_9BASI|nr:hypothetical protein [Austropuccinia psidii MF-1]